MLLYLPSHLKITNSKKKKISITIEPLNISAISKSSNILGSGTFGTVYEGTYHGSTVAIKVISEKVDINNFTKEIQALLKLRHPCCVTILGYLINPEPMIIMELYPFTLSTIIYNYEITFELKKVLVLDIISGLLYLHSINMIHRDLKPGNILITHDYHAKISDFGTALINRTTTNNSRNLVGTIYYIAPERCFQNKYSTATDIYAIGIIVWQIFEQDNLFDDQPKYKDLTNQLTTLIAIHTDKARPTFKEVLKNDKLKSVIEQLWHSEESVRKNLNLETIAQEFKNITGVK